MSPRKKRVLLAIFGGLCLIALLAVAATVLWASSGSKWNEIRAYTDKYVDQFLEDGRELAKEDFWKSVGGTRDAGPLLNKKVPWSHLPVGTHWKNPPDVSKETHDGLSEFFDLIRDGGYSPEDEKNRWAALAAKDVGAKDVDLSWMSDLKRFDLWSVDRDSPAAETKCPPAQAVRCVWGGPSLNVVVLADIPKIRMYRGWRDKSTALAAREVRNFARLLMTTESLLPVVFATQYLFVADSITAVALARGDSDVATDGKAAFPMTSYQRLHRFYRDGKPFLSFAVSAPTWKKVIDGLPRHPVVCPFLNDALSLALLESPFIEPQVPLETSYRWYYEGLDRLLRETATICRLEPLRKLWPERAYWWELGHLDETQEGTDPWARLSAKSSLLPFARRWAANLFVSIRSPRDDEYGKKSVLSDWKLPKVRTKEVQEDVSITRHSATRITVTQRFVDKHLQDLTQLLQTARGIPYVDPKTSQFRGFLIQSIEPGSAVLDLGIEPGDIITQVNDLVLTNPGAGLTAFQQLRGKSNVTLYVLRGKKQTALEIHYDVSP